MVISSTHLNKVITLDGPSGSGKGTICRLIANDMGYELLDSGALYRLTALSAHNQNVDFANEQALAAIAHHLDIVFMAGEQATTALLSGVDVTKAIREEKVGMLASKVAAFGLVREALLARQRAFLTPKGLVADGRDMGTVVFTDAPVKIFLTASSDVRAQRRMAQLARANITGDYDTILRDIRQRDDQDRNRKVAPLIPAHDAHTIDCSYMEIIDVQQAITDIIQKAGL